ncbi:MAG: NAD(P)-dependent oxidoreductase [Myxococcota bacterium]|nr:NAD(P)-dependent oxidoreductase [Myxococcota bacterium]
MGEPLAFLCLGAMGGPMAAHLARAGHAVTVWNRTPARAADWVAEHGGQAAATPAEAAEGASVVFACTGNDDALRAVAAGADGAFAGMARGAVFVDHTTVSAEVTRELGEQAAARGVSFVDAPVSGGEEGARRGALTVMAGGPEAAFTRVEPLLACYAKTAVRLGPAGSGQLAKMVNQICIAGLLEGLSEGLAFARRAGLDPRAVVEVIANGAAGSWQMTQRAPTMIEGRFDFGFAVDWMRKDLGIALAEARRNGARLPLTAIVDQLYAELQRRGHGRWDTSSLISLLD